MCPKIFIQLRCLWKWGEARNVWLICCLLLCHPNTTAPMLLHYNSWTSSITLQLFPSVWKIVLQCVSFEYSYRACITSLRFTWMHKNVLYADALHYIWVRYIALHLNVSTTFTLIIGMRCIEIYCMMMCWIALHCIWVHPRCLLLQLLGCGAALYFLHATCHSHHPPSQTF